VLHPAPAFCRSLNFNYSPSVASVCEQFTHASELKKEKKKKRELCLAQPVQLGTVKKDE
jgi:malic enzyme